jgi:hypothetical protein
MKDTKEKVGKGTTSLYEISGAHGVEDEFLAPMMQYTPPKRRFSPTRLHGATSQKPLVFYVPT